MSEKIERQASCLCGAVKFSVTLDNNHVDACHCAMCRTWGGGPFLSVGFDGEIDFEGRDQVGRYSSSDWAERGFCRQCGTHLFYHLKGTEHYAFPAGLLDGGEPWDFREQIFVDEKPGWYAFANDTANLTGKEVFAKFSQE